MTARAVFGKSENIFLNEFLPHKNHVSLRTLRDLRVAFARHAQRARQALAMAMHGARLRTCTDRIQ
jgi:hypothetical protein